MGTRLLDILSYLRNHIKGYEVIHRVNYNNQKINTIEVQVNLHTLIILETRTQDLQVRVGEQVVIPTFSKDANINTLNNAIVNILGQLNYTKDKELLSLGQLKAYKELISNLKDIQFMTYFLHDSFILEIGTGGRPFILEIPYTKQVIIINGVSRTGVTLAKLTAILNKELGN